MRTRGRPGASALPRLGERGAVAAEFAVTLPAVLIVLTLGVGVLGTALTTVRLQHAATEGARLLGRGDDAGAAAALAAAGGSLTVTRGDGLVCVSTSATRALPIALPISPAAARACALDGGR
ncbi:TadE-like protein [Microbacterium sp. ru370.1]|uniref:TadE family protein n=1 Tax=unclassified Microbacterium TaxID=2609290 RepID=UPI000880C74C|nr:MULTISPECIES: TadE family protein [unclassified Microbacterium]SDO98538.1 TadE-like protein [Microbacterium sp. ru370.1]SIT92570.1 TadE-like protein [Microbacterium sp. RU1D]